MDFFKNSVEDTFLLLFEGVSEGVIVVNTTQQIVAANSAAYKMFGYESEELIGAPLNTLIPSNYHHAHDGHFSKFLEHSDKRSMGKGRDIYGLCKNGKSIPVEAGLNPFVLDNHRYVMALISDITIRKNQEKAVLDFNIQLEKKIKERTLQLTEALAKEKELNELKTKFLSLVSHEFKTPLSGILTSATLAGKYTKTEQQEKRKKHIDTIQNKVKYLNTIIDDFLSVERLATGKVNYQFTTFPLNKVLNEVIYNANLHLKEGQRINYPNHIDDIYIEYDEKVLELILSNLIHNAIKYSSENSTIDVLVNTIDTNLSLLIKDEGIGIPEEEQKHVFNRYFRAENALTIQGTGIGLNIVKGHIENLGGEIQFTSEENKGSSFSILLTEVLRT